MARGQCQGHKKKIRGQCLGSFSENRPSRGQRQECSKPRPRTQAQVFSKKKVFKKIFQAIYKKKVSKICFQAIHKILTI